MITRWREPLSLHQQGMSAKSKDRAAPHCSSSSSGEGSSSLIGSKLGDEEDLNKSVVSPTEALRGRAPGEETTRRRLAEASWLPIGREGCSFVN